jgi:Fungal specific transcription factor domain
MIHLQSCYFNNDSLPVDLWFEMGTIIRLAFRMGYHRDPSKLAGISPFDGEMRRRVWLNIFQVDALMSFQLGFPSMIPTEFCDTEVPRNLEYSDLFVGMTALPTSRPLSEATPVLYTIVKAGVMAVFKKIVAHTQSLSSPAYEETLALETEMNQVYSMVPESLRRRDINRSFIDNSCLIWQRCTIEILYLKGLVILHRRYISYELQSPRYEPSRRACIEAALDILSRQADLHKACEPGGRLYEDRWMIFSLPAHDFLLAAMVVSLDLSVRMRSRRRDSAEGSDYQQLAGREYRALQTSQRIWSISSAFSPEAHVAALALDLMIVKVAENDVNLFLVHDVSYEDTDPVVDSELPYAGTISQMIDGSETVDWVSSQYLPKVNTSLLIIITGFVGSISPEH